MLIHKAIPPELFLALEQRLEKIIVASEAPMYAAFDADGTLWSIDCGELFLKHLQKTGFLKNIEGKTPWDHYCEMRWGSKPKEAIVWLTKVVAGCSLEQARQLARGAFESAQPFPFLEEQKRIIDFLRKKGVEVFVVTASPKWSVEPAAEHFGIDADHVIGLKTTLVDNKLTDKVDGFITSGEGKVDAFLHQVKGQKPLFVSGNTTGDLPLMLNSAGTCLAVASALPGEHTASSEAELARVAALHGWFVHSFS